MRGRKAMGKRRMWFPTLVTAPLSLESRRDVYRRPQTTIIGRLLVLNGCRRSLLLLKVSNRLLRRNADSHIGDSGLDVFFMGSFNSKYHLLKLIYIFRV